MCKGKDLGHIYIASHMIQILEKSQTVVYNSFKEQYPEIKI